MAARATSSASIASQFAGEAKAREEVRTYLFAIYSYPDHFAVRRSLSFRKHLLTIMSEVRRSAAGNRRCRTS